MEFYKDMNIKPPDQHHIFYDENYGPPFSEEDILEYDYEDFAPMPFSLAEIVENCLIPTLEQGYGHVGKVIIWCIIFRIATQSCKF